MWPPLPKSVQGSSPATRWLPSLTLPVDARPSENSFNLLIGNEGGVPAIWRSESRDPPPERVTPVDDRLNAPTALRRAPQGRDPPLSWGVPDRPTPLPALAP